MDTTSLELFIDTAWDKECPVHFKKFLVAYHDWCTKESRHIVRAFRNVARPFLEERGYQFYKDSFYICKTSSLVKKTNIDHMNNFLDTDEIIHGIDLRMPKKLFIQQFRHYCARKDIKRIGDVESLFELPFLTKNLIVVNYSGTYRGKMYAEQDFIFGIDTVEVSCCADIDV
jgi:hypothetical protein